MTEQEIVEQISAVECAAEFEGPFRVYSWFRLANGEAAMWVFTLGRPLGEAQSLAVIEGA